MTKTTCPVCGADKVTVRTIPRALGTTSIVAMVDEVTCRACGEVAEAWHRMSEAFDLATKALIAKPRLLAAGEVTYLRKRLGWKGNELAARLGVTPSSVSRWESGTVPILPLADRALRSFVALDRRLPLDLVELGAIDAKDASPLELTIELTEIGWMPARPATRKSRKAS
jgi:transcriptional regulator with XRE-family HTH domain